MSQSKSGSGAIIVSIIAIGAAYVCFSMFAQTSDNAGSAPQIHALHSSYGKVNEHENPYIEALLNPGEAQEADKFRSGSRFARLLRAKMGGKDGPMAVASVPASNANNVALGLLADQLAAAAKNDNSAASIEASKNVLSYAREHEKESSSAVVDLLLDSARLSKKALNFDLSRDCINQGILQSRQLNDYKMDDLEGLRCILSGNRDELISYNTAMAAFSDKLSQSEYAALPALAGELLQKTRFLPGDSYFKMQAELCQATSLLLTKAQPAAARAIVDKVQAEADRVQDQAVAAQCRELTSHFAIINGR